MTLLAFVVVVWFFVVCYSAVSFPCVDSLALGAVPPASSLAYIGLSAGDPSRPFTPALSLALVSTAGLPVVPSQHSDLSVSLSMSSRLLPPRLVQQIRAGRFVEMQDLLPDNIQVRSRLEELNSLIGVQLLPVSSRPRVRDVPTLSSWVAFFLTFLAVGTSDPVTRDRLAYAILIVKEATRHGGSGWLEYDRLRWRSIRYSLGMRFILSCRPLLFWVSGLLLMLCFVRSVRSVIMLLLSVHCGSCRLLRLPLELDLVCVRGRGFGHRICFS